MMEASRKGRLALIGGGQMAEALIGGLLAAGTWTPEQIIATDPSEGRREELRARFGVGLGQTIGRRPEARRR